MSNRRCSIALFMHGFTLIELVVVMVLIGILAISVVGRLNSTDGFAERALHDRLMSAVQYARKVAVANRRYVCVNVSFNRATFTIDNDQPEGVVAFAALCEANLDLPAADRDCGGASNQVCAAAGRSLAVSSGAASFQFDPAGRTQAAVVLRTSGNLDVTIEANTGYVH